MIAQSCCHVTLRRTSVILAACVGQSSTRMKHRLLAGTAFILSLFLNFCSSQSYFLSDKEGLGRVFDGIGGLSGGGVSRVLLPGTNRPRKGLKKAARVNLLITLTYDFFRRHHVYWSTMPTRTAARYWTSYLR